MKKSSTPGLSKALKIFVLISIICILSIDLFYGFYIYADNKDDPSKSLYHRFYQETENSLDGLYVGASSTYRYWMPTRAYEKYGQCVYNFSTASMPFAAYQYIIEECAKTQDFEYVIIELRRLYKPTKNFNPLAARKILKPMKPSATKLKAIDAVLDFAKASSTDKDVDTNFINYFNYAYIVHSMLDDETFYKWTSIVDERGKYKGFKVSGNSFKQTPSPAITTDGKSISPIEPLFEDCLDKLIKYCKTLDCHVVFVTAPLNTEEENLSKINYALKKAEDNGFDTINFNTQQMREALGVDYSRDFYNERHMNVWGAMKYTDYLSDYLDDRYETEDHRGQEGYESWQKAARDLNDILSLNGVEQ